MQGRKTGSAAARRSAPRPQSDVRTPVPFPPRADRQHGACPRLPRARSRSRPASKAALRSAQPGPSTATASASRSHASHQDAQGGRERSARRCPCPTRGPAVRDRLSDGSAPPRARRSTHADRTDSHPSPRGRTGIGRDRHAPRAWRGRRSHSPPRSAGAPAIRPVPAPPAPPAATAPAGICAPRSASTSSTESESIRRARYSRNRADARSSHCPSSTTRTSGARSAKPATSQYKPCITEARREHGSGRPRIVIVEHRRGEPRQRRPRRDHRRRAPHSRATHAPPRTRTPSRARRPGPATARARARQLSAAHASSSEVLPIPAGPVIRSTDPIPA